jgi:hypothetical protein
LVNDVEMPQPLVRLGIIGMSEGNGHPYSWAAIANGYNFDAMRSCPFPAIPKYLEKQKYPDDFLQGVRVTHIWCDDRAQAEHIASAARIETVVDNPQAMVNEVDAILLARDDARNHWRYAAPFLQAELPIYTLDDAERLLATDPEDRRIFSCSALRYADELYLAPDELETVGDIQMIDAWAPKYWETYAVHMIEPLIAQFLILDEVGVYEVCQQKTLTQLVVTWRSGVVTRFTTHGSQPSAIGFKVYGTKGDCEKTFFDSFGAFKKALACFIGVARGNEQNIPREQTRRIVELVAMAVPQKKGAE